MIILVAGTNEISGKTVSVVCREQDLMNDHRKYYALVTGYYDPDNNFKPVFGGSKDKRRRLHEVYANEHLSQVEEADKVFDKMKEMYAARQIMPQEPAKKEPVQQQSSGLGLQLESALIEVLAKQSTDKVLEAAKPLLEEHIINTFGVLPQVHEIKIEKFTHKIQGVVHEKFDTVLQLVGADIPVFLTGAAGTGKNVICKQVAEALGLEFYFSNAVTQEYKLTGFIDANGTFHETQFFKAFTEGGLFMLDEIDASIPEVLIILNAAIANRYFDFPTGRFDAHENFRLIAAGNTFGTGADLEYTGRFQLDAASLDRFGIVEINYSEAIENALAAGDKELTEFIRAFRNATQAAGIKHLATYRAIERIKKIDTVLDDTAEALKICLTKGLGSDDINIIASNVSDRISSSNKYLKGLRSLA
jgi:MoxR-like ATPase